MPKVVIAVVPGWAVGGGHSLHVTCDLTLASKEHAISNKLMQMSLVLMVVLDQPYLHDKQDRKEHVRFSF